MAVSWTSGKDIMRFKNLESGAECILVYKYIDYSWGKVITGIDSVHNKDGSINNDTIPKYILLLSNLLYISAYGCMFMTLILVLLMASLLTQGAWVEGILCILGIVVLLYANSLMSDLFKSFIVRKYFPAAKWK